MASGQPTLFPLFLIHSPWSLRELENFLFHFGNGKVGPLRIDYDRDGKETNRTLAILDESVFADLVKKGYTRSDNSEPTEQYCPVGWETRRPYRNFSIYRYKIRPYEYPRNGFTTNLIVSLPQDLSVEECRRQLDAKMSILAGFNLLKKEDYQLSLPLSSRVSGQAKGIAFITFQKEVDPQLPIVVRAILNGSHWKVEDQWEPLLCRWTRNSPPKGKSVPKNISRPTPAGKKGKEEKGEKEGKEKK
jgi:hypothetical protein